MGRSQRLPAVAGLVATLSLAGCPGFGDQSLAELEGISGVPTWHADVQPIVVEFCQPCHRVPTNRGAPFPLLTFAQVRSQASRIQVRVVQEGSMPPRTPLPDAERAVLEAWIAGGTPEGIATGPELDQGVVPVMDAGVVDAAPDADPAADAGAGPTWDDAIGPFTAGACTSCHDSTEFRSGGLDLTSYRGFLARGDSNLDVGPLMVERLTSANEGVRMPLGGEPRSAAEIAAVRAWVAAGTPEN